MLVGKNSIQETYYDILHVKEDASYKEIRVSYRSAILNFHPDKLVKTNEMVNPSEESGDRFLKVQKAWEILSNSMSRALYDNELQGSRAEIGVAEDVGIYDMMVEDNGDTLVLCYQCQCGDYFSVDSLELGTTGYELLRDINKVSLHTGDGLPASLVLPCRSCSLQLRLLINVKKSSS
ncbi:DPH4 [Tripterygium wilfordii]|uniref:DPH4 n=1 Tax=Tripterygium wilfordii TaxID=458696 RepID=A0A7J7CC27_TRIWF|nr:DPH4 [Tripterygium wilfordii]